jgi:RNA polymerase sigma-32 factor
VLSHLRFVVHIARGYLGYGLPMSDLVQEGNVGLMKAVKRYDPEVGVRLVTFAVHWIRAEIHEYVLRNWRLVKIATTKAQRKLFFNLRRMKPNLGWLTANETQAVAADLGVTTTEVTEMERRSCARHIVRPGAGRRDEDGPSPICRHRSDPALLAEAEETDRLQRAARRGRALARSRSRDILQRRWMGEKKATLHELAAEYGVSEERIRQIEATALTAAPPDARCGCVIRTTMSGSSRHRST